MTGSHQERLEQLKVSVDSKLEEDLARDRQNFIAESFRFLKLAWEMDADTHQRLSVLGGIAAGELVELFVTGTLSDTPGLDNARERLAEITFTDFSGAIHPRKLKIGFLLPIEADFTDATALEGVEEPQNVYVVQSIEDGLQVNYWITSGNGPEPYIIPDLDGGNDGGNYSGLDGALDEEPPEIIRAREAALITSFRDSLTQWHMIASKILRITQFGNEEL